MSTEDPDRHTEPMLAEVDRILTTIQENYGLDRRDAIGCLQTMASSLETLRPGDPGLKEDFHKGVELWADTFSAWALKVGRNVLRWGDHPLEGEQCL